MLFEAAPLWAAAAEAAAAAAVRPAAAAPRPPPPAPPAGDHGDCGAYSVSILRQGPLPSREPAGSEPYLPSSKTPSSAESESGRGVDARAPQPNQ